MEGFLFHGIAVLGLFCNGISGIDKKMNGETGSKLAADIGISG